MRLHNLLWSLFHARLTNSGVREILAKTQRWGNDSETLWFRRNFGQIKDPNALVQAMSHGETWDENHGQDHPNPSIPTITPALLPIGLIKPHPPNGPPPPAPALLPPPVPRPTHSACPSSLSATSAAMYMDFMTRREGEVSLAWTPTHVRPIRHSSAAWGVYPIHLFFFWTAAYFRWLQYLGSDSDRVANASFFSGIAHMRTCSHLDWFINDQGICDPSAACM
jgi:hypothetical protein